MKQLVLVLLATCAACGPNGRGSGNGVDGNTGSNVDSGTNNIVDAPPNAQNSLVYAHSASTLYIVDTTSYATTEIGDFSGINDDVTDIAVDKNGNMVAITATTLYTVDVSNAAATSPTTVSNAEDFTGLGYVPDPANDATDLLVTASAEGDVYTIDPTSGASTKVGNYGKVGNNQIASSGDIFGVRGFGTYATVKVGSATNDYLAQINTSTWAATVSANDTGFQNIYGLGFWAGTIFGFDDAGDVLEINPATGAATKVGNDITVEWWGAGVTTNAPIVE